MYRLYNLSSLPGVQPIFKAHTEYFSISKANLRSSKGTARLHSFKNVSQLAGIVS